MSTDSTHTATTFTHSPLGTPRPEIGILDTSVVIDLENLHADLLPERSTISAVTLAELAGGVYAARSEQERSARMDRLQRTEANFTPIPFDARAARAYGRIYAAVVTAGRQPRRRFAYLQIAATALAHDLPLFTRNPHDFLGLEHLIHVYGI